MPQQHYPRRYAGNRAPKLDTPGTAQRAADLKARLAQLRGEVPEPKYLDTLDYDERH